LKARKSNALRVFLSLKKASNSE